ncbi:MAG: hypothetical protein IE909_09820, partial [Campylobacterales bacterium]|nr:hypothetical protein [Campylobacterales bacterium]
MEKLQREREAYQKEVTKTKIMTNMTKAIEQGRFTDTHQGQTLMGLLYTPLKEKIEEYFEAYLTSHRLKIRQYIQLICDDPKELAYVLVKVLVDIIILKGNNVTITKLSIDLMRALKKLYYFDQLEKTNPKLHSFLGNEYIRASKRRKEELIKTRIKHLIDPTRIENKQLEVRAGAVLLDLVFLAGTDDIIYKRAVKNKDGSQTYIASFRYEILQTLFNEIKVNKQIVDSPMVCPPRDWTSPNSGGYLTRQIPLVKVYNRKDKEIINKADFSKILPVINKLQQIKWRVNKRVYEVISTIFYQNMIDPKSPPTLPRCYGDIPSPNFIDVYDIIPKREYVQNPTEEEKKEWYSWNRQREQIKISLDSEAGRRLEFLSTLTMAEDMIKFEQFYYVYQLDYRGRVYIHSQFLHPQSGGYTKALLEFGEGRILNEEGERWLGVHLANCWGLDKASFDIRKEWVEENKTLILQVAEEPFSTLSIWTEADSPYEFLAACFAYKDFKEGLPVHLPIQLDAVNSGIQFYSGLLLDAEGAESCCVIGNKRSDLYGIIANKVNEKLNNGEYPKFISFTTREKEHITLSTKVEAESLKGKITRNMTKRNVMTVPYSVTIQGMREQNWDVMDEAKLKQKQFWEGDSWVVNYLLTYLIHEAI